MPESSTKLWRRLYSPPEIGLAGPEGETCGKREGASKSCTRFPPPKKKNTRSWHLFVHDYTNRLRSLSDAGADISVPPARQMDGRKPCSNRKLYVANRTVINTYGHKTVVVDLQLQKKFKWTFVVADVSYPIIGADFLKRFGLMPDLRCRRIINGADIIDSPLYHVYSCLQLNQFIRRRQPIFSALLKEFPGIKDTGERRHCDHNTVHVVETKGQPVATKTKRLPLEKPSAVKKQIPEMFKVGDIRLRKSPWASAITLRPKGGPYKWRICGDYRSLNAMTKPDRYLVSNILDFNVSLAGEEHIYQTGRKTCLLSYFGSKRKHIEDGDHHTNRVVRVSGHAIWSPKCGANIPAIYLWSARDFD